MADLNEITERLERVASWHTGRQRRFVEEIITDLAGNPPAAPTGSTTGTTATAAGSTPGEGAGAASSSIPAVPPG